MTVASVPVEPARPSVLLGDEGDRSDGLTIPPAVLARAEEVIN